MEDKRLLMIVLAFILGYMCSGMMKNMCGRRLLEGEEIKRSVPATTCEPMYQARSVQDINDGLGLPLLQGKKDPAYLNIIKKCNSYCEHTLDDKMADYCEPI